MQMQQKRCSLCFSPPLTQKFPCSFSMESPSPNDPADAAHSGPPGRSQPANTWSFKRHTWALWGQTNTTLQNNTSVEKQALRSQQEVILAFYISDYFCMHITRIIPNKERPPTLFSDGRYSIGERAVTVKGAASCKNWLSLTFRLASSN